MRFGTHLAAFFICATVVIGRAIAGSTIDVHPSQVLAPVNVGIMGAGSDNWFNDTLSGLYQSFLSSGITQTRYPGGSQADIYHWKSGTDGPGACARQCQSEIDVRQLHAGRRAPGKPYRRAYRELRLKLGMHRGRRSV